MRRRTLHFVAVMRLVLALLIPGGLGTVYAEAPGCELCIENSPVTAGRVTPNTGTHRFSPDSVVTVSAEPEPGYEFSYWIGDVGNPKARSTTVQLNTSKIVVAVFEPAYDEDMEKKVAVGGGGGGGGGRGGSLSPTRVDFRSPGFGISGGGGGGGVKKGPALAPVVVTPEPSTILLVGLGALAARRRRRCT